MAPLTKYYTPIVYQYIKLDELIQFTNFQGGEFLLGEDSGSRVRPVTCYKFKMDWIVFRLIKFASCIFHAQRCIIDDGLVDETTVDDLMDLFIPAFDFFQTSVTTIRDIDCICDQNDMSEVVPDVPYEAKRLLKLQEIREQEARVTRMLRGCKAATKTLVDELKVYLSQMVNVRADDDMEC